MKTFLLTLLRSPKAAFSRLPLSRQPFSNSSSSNAGSSEPRSSELPRAELAREAAGRAGGFRRPDPGAVGRVFRSLMDEHIRGETPWDQDRLFAQIQRDTRRKRRGPLPDTSSRRATFVRLAGWSAAPLLAAAVSLAIGLRQPESADGRLSYSAQGYQAQGYSKLDPSAKADAPPSSVPEQDEMRRWVSGDKQLVLSFSDQSEVRLEPQTTIDVRILPSNRALFNLAGGKVHVNVHHQDHTDYRFQAGSYEVLVTGTAFELGFEPKAEHVALHMREGRVEVHTPHGEVRVVRGGESFERSRPQPIEVARAIDAATVIDAGGAQAPSSPNEREPRASRRAPGSSESERRAASGASSEASLSYAALARDGKFSEIVQDAMGRGLNSVLSSKPPSELIQLSHAARYVGHADLARPVLQALVRKYGATSEGRAAIFFLGRLSDGAGDGATAAQQYEQYLKLEPRGAYAPEALGRRMILAQRNNPQLAAKLARDYLARFPQGSYKTHASALLKVAGLADPGSR